MQIFVYIVVVSFRFVSTTHTLVYVCSHLFTNIALLFPSITKSFANLSPSPARSLSVSVALPFLFLENFYYYCFLLWFYFSRIGFTNERRKKVFSFSFSLLKHHLKKRERKKWKRWKFYCKNVMTIENAMVMVSNALVKIISEYVRQLRARQMYTETKRWQDTDSEERRKIQKNKEEAPRRKKDSLICKFKTTRVFVFSRAELGKAELSWAERGRERTERNKRRKNGKCCEMWFICLWRAMTWNPLILSSR